MGRKVCRTPGCPTIIDSTAYRGLCPPCARAWDQARGTRAERGYDAAFSAARAKAKALVNAGGVLCWRCGKPIQPGSTFHFGHDDDDRSIIRGPEHPTCNLSAAGRSSHR